MLIGPWCRETRRTRPLGAWPLFPEGGGHGGSPQSKGRNDGLADWGLLGRRELMPGLQQHPSESITNALRAVKRSGEVLGRPGGDSVGGGHQGYIASQYCLMAISFVQILDLKRGS